MQNTEAKEGTFAWIWLISSFVEWLSNPGGVYWISGKPGSGKSTLVEYLTSTERTELHLRRNSNIQWIVLRFFFDFGGGKGLKNSFEGLLRSLLYQLIKAMPQLNTLALDDSEHNYFSSWPEHRLRNVLRTLLKDAKKGACIFVDGVDEYEGGVISLIQFLENLTTDKYGQWASIKVCVSSRPEPEPFQFLQHRPNISMSDHNESGIRSYSRRTLKALGSEAHKDLDILRLSDVIATRAEGVFLWARFALSELIRGYCQAEDIRELERRLENIPRSLEEVYDRMLGRMEPLAKKECMIMLRLVCFAKRELLWEEFLVATGIAMDKDAVFYKIFYDDMASPNYAPDLCKSLAKRIRAKAVGLLELVNTKDIYGGTFLTLRLIHRTVRTYLDLKGWQILGEVEGANSVGHESFYVKIGARYLHRLLRRCKLERNTTISARQKWLDESDLYHFVLPGIDASNDFVSIYPFFTYAAAYIFEHARSFERYGASSYPLLHSHLTEQLFRFHSFCDGMLIGSPCRCCHHESLIFSPGDFDAIYVALLHGLVSYCKSDLATRVPAPGQELWDRALLCAMPASNFRPIGRAFGVQATVSLALQSLTTLRNFIFSRRSMTLGCGIWCYNMSPSRTFGLPTTMRRLSLFFGCSLEILNTILRSV